MGYANRPNPSAPMKLYTGQGAHLAALVAQRTAPRGCFVCRQPFRAGEETLGPPECERCGVVMGHFACYVTAVAHAPREREFFANTDPDDLGLGVLMLCLGCRS